MKKIIYSMQLLVILSNITFSQWNSEWNSSNISAINASGWLKFQTNLDKGGERFYIVDASKFSIMTNEYSETPEYTYTFTADEVASGNLIYSLGYDLTGDNYVEFYIIIRDGTADQYRQSFKIIDITNGNVLFERNNSGYFYTYPVIWDVDNDGILECTFATYDYPNFNNYVYEVYSTGVATNTEGGLPVSLSFELKQNYPNPFNPSTTIEYTLNKPGFVSIDIYNIKGELVNNVYSGYRETGTYKEVWNGQSSVGTKVSSGTYFYQITQDGNKTTKKMLLLK